MSDVIEGEEGDGPVISERVQVLAQGIYDELQGMMDAFGQESIANLMPLVVNVLENLDSALSDNQDHLTALMEVNEENETLLKQYDREKQKRKEIEDKAMRLEDVSEVEVRELKAQMGRVNSENRGLGAKMASQKEQIDRLEERCEDLLREKKGLHDKNIGLIKNFHGQMESFKALKITEARNKAADEGGDSSKRPPGFQDFMAPVKAGKKKRTLPIAPQRRNRGEGEEEDDVLLGVTPSERPDSPEFARGESIKIPPNLRSLHEEQTWGEEEEERESYEEGPRETFEANEDSLLAELHLATTGSTATGVDQIITENEELMTAKNQLTKEVDELTTKLTATENDKKATESELTTLQNDRDSLSARTAALEGEVKRMRRELEEEKEKTAQLKEAEEKGSGEGLRLTKLEVARVLRERNEYKEKYLSLLEQVRMNDELYLFKKSKKASRWVDYFAALFSPAKRRQLEKVLDGTSRRPILGATRKTPDAVEEEDEGEAPQAGPAGYCMTHTIPTLRRMGKRQEELLTTSVSWLTSPSSAQHSNQTELQTVSTPPLCPSINTCRPMSYQEEGTKVLCAAAVNPSTFLSDHSRAITVSKKVTPPPEGTVLEKGRPPVYLPDDGEESMSLVWIVTGVPTLTKVSVLDAAAMGEVLESFIVSSTPVQCIAAIPAFDENDPDVLTSLSSARRRRSNAVTSGSPPPPHSQADRPSSRDATMWMGSDQGVFYVHSAVTQWRRCIHADKLPAAIQSIIHIKGKVFVLLANSSVAVFRRFPDGEWDWDNYSVVYLSQKKDLPVTAMASVKFNVWCAIGNSIHVIHSHLLKMEATFAVHSRKRAVVGDLVVVGDGVWVSFFQDSTLRLYNGTTFTHMQDVDIAPTMRKNIVFGGEKRSHMMPIQISCLVAAHNSLWVGTENGILLTFPFNAPAVVAEETGWEVIKEAEVGGSKVPEPFDVRMEQAEEAGSLAAGAAQKKSKQDRSPAHSLRAGLNCALIAAAPLVTTESSVQSSEEAPLPPQQINMSAPPRAKPFTPFCNVDQSQISIHCHINAAKTLLCVPGMVPQDIAMFEPLGGVFIGTGDSNKLKPALFVVSCGEGHLDLRTADKVMETLQAKESGQSDLPDAASIISEKNYVMVWDVVVE